MLPVQAPGKAFEGREGTLLCQILLQQGIDLLNNRFSLVRSLISRLINRLINRCRSGNCGTCTGQPCKAGLFWGWQERRDELPSPHSPMKNWRLACQTEELGNGFWQELGSLRVQDDGFWMAIPWEITLGVSEGACLGLVLGAGHGTNR